MDADTLVPQSSTHLQLHSETWHEDIIGVEKELHARFVHVREIGEWVRADDPEVSACVDREGLMRYYERRTAEIVALAIASSDDSTVSPRSS